MKCLHCEEPSKWKLLCPTCAELLELITPPPDPHIKIHAALEMIGPANSLIRLLRSDAFPYLSKSLAGFIVAQHHQLHWPLPDLIVPVPMQPLRRLIHRYNPAELLAQEVARIFKVPTIKALHKRLGRLPQRILPPEKRYQMPKSHITIRKGVDKKRILLVDDYLKTGTTLKVCSRRLIEAGALDVHALAACKEG